MHLAPLSHCTTIVLFPNNYSPSSLYQVGIIQMKQVIYYRDPVVKKLVNPDPTALPTKPDAVLPSDPSAV